MRRRAERLLLVWAAIAASGLMACQLILGLEEPVATPEVEAGGASDASDGGNVESNVQGDALPDTLCTPFIDHIICDDFSDPDLNFGNWRNPPPPVSAKIEYSDADFVSPTFSMHAFSFDGGDGSSAKSAYVQISRVYGAPARIEFDARITRGAITFRGVFFALAFTKPNKGPTVSSPALFDVDGGLVFAEGLDIADADVPKDLGATPTSWFHVKLEVFLAKKEIEVNVYKKNAAAPIHATFHMEPLPDTSASFGVFTSNPEPFEVYIDNVVIVP
jgi:hypothetical protein